MDIKRTLTFKLADNDQIEIEYKAIIDKSGQETVDWNSVNATRIKDAVIQGVLTDNPAAFLLFFIKNEGRDIYKYDWPIEMEHRERAYKKIRAFLGEYAWFVRSGRGIPARFSRKPDEPEKTDSPVIASGNESEAKTKTLVDDYRIVEDGELSADLVSNAENIPDIIQSHSDGFSSDKTGKPFICCHDIDEMQDYLHLIREICTFYPSASFLGEETDVPLESLFIPRRLTTEDRSCIEETDDQISLVDVATNEHMRIALVGNTNSGRYTLIRSFVLRILDKENGIWFDKKENNGSYNHIDLGFFFPFFMDLREIVSEKEVPVDFLEYIKLFIFKWNQLYNKSLNAENFVKFLFSGSTKPLFIIYGIDVLPDSGEGITKLSFIDALYSFLSCSSKNNISILLSIDKDSLKFIRGLSIKVNMTILYLVPIEEQDKRLFCDKWIRYKSIRSLRFRDDDLNENSKALYNAITNSYAFKTDNPLYLTYYVIMFSKYNLAIDAQTELMLLSRLSSMVIIQLISTPPNENIKLSDEYDLLIPISFIACKLIEMNIDSLPLRHIDSDNYSVEDMLRSEIMGIAGSPYLTDSMLLGVGDASNVDTLISYFERFPLIQIDSQQGYLRFCSPIWMEYYASYAIANGIQTDQKYLNQSRELYLIEQIDYQVSHNRTSQYMRVLSGAAILSGKDVGDYVDLLCHLIDIHENNPKHFRTQNMLTRVFCGCTLLAILAQRPFLNFEKRQKALFYSLGYYLYYEQLDYLKKIMASSPYRASFVNCILEGFAASYSKEDSFTDYSWVIGYIQWINPNLFISTNEKAEYDFQSMFFPTTDQKQREHFSILQRRIAVLMDQKQNSDHSTLLICILGCCVFLWTKDRDYSETGAVDDRKTNSGDGSGLYSDILTSIKLFSKLLYHCDWRISNAAAHSLAHIVSFTKLYSYLFSDKLQRMRCMLSEPSFLDGMIIADYNMVNDPSLDLGFTECGVSRLISLIPLSYFEYGRAFEGNIPDKLIRCYKDKWIKMFHDAAMDDGSYKSINATRYLMLKFKILYYIGAFDTKGKNVDPLNLLYAIETILKLKDRHFNFFEMAFSEEDNNRLHRIGLKFDNEDDFFSDLIVLAKQLCG